MTVRALCLCMYNIDDRSLIHITWHSLYVTVTLHWSPTSPTCVWMEKYNTSSVSAGHTCTIVSGDGHTRVLSLYLFLLSVSSLWPGPMCLGPISSSHHHQHPVILISIDQLGSPLPLVSFKFGWNCQPIRAGAEYQQKARSLKTKNCKDATWI